MSDMGQANYDGYRRESGGKSLVSGDPIPEWDDLPRKIRDAWTAGADAVEQWLADAPVDEDMPGNEQLPDDAPQRFALVEQMGHRATVASVREATFCGKQMLELTDLKAGSVHLVAPESLYEVTWLTESDARARAKPWTATAIDRVRPAGWPDDDLEDTNPDDADEASYHARRAAEADL